ncbi:MAG: CCDC90 family protein [Thermodesulfovibrionales bacterium]|nr:CCDC90 family protein [Thermodesulfovibrionales bacterium]
MIKRVILLKPVCAILLCFFLPSYIYSEPVTKEDIRRLREEMRENIKALREDMRVLNEQINNRIDDTNNRIDDLRETMFWLFGTFIGIALILIGFVIRNLWFLGHEVKVVKQSLETQRDELNFLKGLIEKLVVGRQ